MYAISFDLKVDELKKHYGELYNNAYDEIKKELETLGFIWTQGNLYINEANTNGLMSVYKAIDMLKGIKWFKTSVRDIKVFKVESFSDFTEIFK